MRTINRKTASLFCLAALCFLIVALFYVTDGKTLVGGLFFAGAVSMAAAAILNAQKGAARGEDKPEPQKVLKDMIEIRRLEKKEQGAALRLSWQVFTEFESPVYPPEGTEEFKRCLNDDAYLAGMEYYGAFCGDKLVGVIGVRERANHICFFFVDGRYHRMGIGTKLFARLMEDYAGRTLTLNSSPYGLPFYEKLGFSAVDEEQMINGIRFTAMEYKGDGNNA